MKFKINITLKQFIAPLCPLNVLFNAPDLPSKHLANVSPHAVNTKPSCSIRVDTL